MTKLLIVSSDERVSSSLARTTRGSFDEVKAVTHREALSEFLTWEPSHVLVNDYYEGKFSEDDALAAGARTWKDLQASATGIERMIRMSFENYPHENFIRLPFRIEELKQKLLSE